MFYALIALIVISIFLFVKRKKPGYLLLPIAAMGVYVVVQIALVPMGFFETIKFIFSLR
ncbi:hypothetical protein ACLIBG_14740 [Virgibacillus sp. W0181]|uniref:hypothetical protein n=1 Tax=Virgibacillus sp. W0181 TaxID=3391581 RepID=UPI003F48E4AF